MSLLWNRFYLVSFISLLKRETSHFKVDGQSISCNPALYIELLLQMRMKGRQTISEQVAIKTTSIPQTLLFYDITSIPCKGFESKISTSYGHSHYCCPVCNRISAFRFTRKFRKKKKVDSKSLCSFMVFTHVMLYWWVKVTLWQNICSFEAHRLVQKFPWDHCFRNV